MDGQKEEIQVEKWTNVKKRGGALLTEGQTHFSTCTETDRNIDREKETNRDGEGEREREDKYTGRGELRQVIIREVVKT